jgi:hypothetical protein
MRKSKLFLIILLFFISTSVTTTAQTYQIRVENIDNSIEEYNSCGTRLGFDREDENGYFFIYTGERTVINIDGELVELNLESSTEKENGSVKKGGKFTVSYTAKGLKVVIDYEVSGNSDNTVQYKGVLKITKGKNKRSIKIAGWSGC